MLESVIEVRLELYVTEIFVLYFYGIYYAFL